MQQQRKRRRRRRRLSPLISAGLLAGGAALFWAGFGDVQNLLDIRADLASDHKKAAELEKRQQELEQVKENLDNPDYIEYIARGKYLVSKEGEQVFKFPSIESEKDE